MITLEQELIEQIQKLDTEQQRLLLAIARQFQPRQARTLGEVIDLARELAFPKEDIAEMARFIEAHEERIDLDEWNKPAATFT